MTNTIAIVGPTGVGKTEVSIAVAETLDGEIVSSDSRQIYVGMDIGTDKVSIETRKRVPHHLIDVLPPTETCDAAKYAGLARAAIDEITGRHKIPVVVGGSGFYISSLFFGLSPLPSASESLRVRLRKEAEEQGWGALFKKLADVDPDTARRIHPNDHYRVMRALEVYYLTGSRPSSLKGAGSPFDESAEFFGLTRDRDELYAGIDQRVDRMIELGLLEETRALVEEYGETEVLLSTVGYREMIGVLNGSYGLEEGVYRTKTTSRNLAKRQMTWFRKLKPVQWVDLSRTRPDEAAAMITGHIGDKGANIDN
jgi:tRNA dimethylallyltransferase